MILPALPSGVNKNNLFSRIDIVLKNEILNEKEYQIITSNVNNLVVISYSGNQTNLDMLIQQLSQIRNSKIKLEIGKCIINHALCLPFDELSKNVEITFFDEPENGSDFNNYLINCNETVLKGALNRIDSVTKERIIAERKILKEFLQKLSKSLELCNIDIEKCSAQEKMDSLFNYVRKHYPYDFTITGTGGSFVPGLTDELGGTAKITYERGKGVCSGRSRLLKLLANNKSLNVPCYLVDGYYGNLGHAWNEFITDDGEIMEYDLSFGMRCKLEELKPCYSNLTHEAAVEKVLTKKIK